MRARLLGSLVYLLASAAILLLLAYLVVLSVHRLSGLSLWQAFSIVRFLLLYSTALGVYLFGWVATKKQTAGLVAAVFFLVTPACSAWMVGGEAFPQAAAMIWLPVGLACLAGYLDHCLAQSHSGARRLWF